jgi:hypothetical protein
MTSRRSAGSIFWGLTLVVIGGLLLAQNLGYAVPIWGPLALYWPALIIAWGLIKLLDYFRLRRSGDARRLFSPGEVAMLIIVIFAGSAITAAANFSPGFAGFLDFPQDFDFWDITGNNYEYTEHLESEVTPESTIEIVNLYGSVDVQASGSNRIILDVKKTVRAASRQEADSRAGQFTFSIQNRGGKILIASSRDKDFGQATGTGRFGNDRRRYKSSLTIQAPARASLDLNNRNGNVVLNLPSSAAFSIDARTRSGEIACEFEGLRVDSSGRERSLSGRVGNGGPQITIETRNGDIRIGKRG